MHTETFRAQACRHPATRTPSSINFIGLRRRSCLRRRHDPAEDLLLSQELHWPEMVWSCEAMKIRPASSVTERAKLHQGRLENVQLLRDITDIDSEFHGPADFSSRLSRLSFPQLRCCVVGNSTGSDKSLQHRPLLPRTASPMNAEHLAIRLHRSRAMAFEFFMPFSRLHDLALSSRVDDDKSAVGVVLDGAAGNVHDESTFRHFLELERRRAAQADRPCLLLFVSLPRDPFGSRRGSSFPRALSASLFAALEESVRDVDLVGWYREGRIAAVLLPQAVDAPPSVQSVVAERVKKNLRRRLPAIGAQLRVRVVRVAHGTA